MAFYEIVYVSNKGIGVPYFYAVKLPNNDKQNTHKSGSCIPIPISVPIITYKLK